jgi:hypothetical protein
VLVAVAMGVWVFFAGYLAWYVTLAKCDAPISADEAKVLWEMHKQSSCCGGSRCAVWRAKAARCWVSSASAVSGTRRSGLSCLVRLKQAIKF